MRDDNDKGRLPVRHYARKVGCAILRYSICYPVVLWRQRSSASRHRPLKSCPMKCAPEWFQESERRETRNLSRRVKGNVPRPLYRHWVENTGPDAPQRQLQIDQKALKQRRRLSFRYGDQRPSPESLRNAGELPRERCYLLDLPPEIRYLIWEYAVGNRKIHIFYSNPARLWEERINAVPKLRCVECVYRPSPNGWENLNPMFPTCVDCGVAWDSCAECRFKVDWRNTPTPGWDVLPPSTQRGTCYHVEVGNKLRPLALLSTCRMIYNEGIDVLYRTNTFHFPLPKPWFRNPHTPPKLIEDFLSTLLPQRLEQITRVSAGVYFPQFKTLNDVLARNLPGLRYLELRARKPGRDYATDLDPDTNVLSQLVMGVRSRVAGAKIVLRADLDVRVPPTLGTQLPEALEVVVTPDEAWERSGFMFWRF
ncbi:hypothetical protein F4777DRAFT_271451 [Nemania sp. FL0916]|nr:hypothetical protein F4777DRAFT_271451 [Nemania sp. FL0916]